MANIQQVKQRFGIIGNSAGLNRAIDTALQVAPTDLSVLITGESGSGKEVFSQIIHNYSSRKHSHYIPVNCGAIPDGTIDSELFGHEKGAFTGAIDSRKGYFEVADKGTIFLDEVGELPLSTQVRLLRVLEAGEFIRVGSSKVQKLDVRVVAATNVKMQEAIEEKKFREDLYYRLNTVPIFIPPLRDRAEDIPLLFKKFAIDTAEKYRMPALKLTDEAKHMLMNYRWPGNIRQLKNVAEHIAIIEERRELGAEEVMKYLPDIGRSNLPAIVKKEDNASFANEREILYKILFDLKSDVNDLKKLVFDIVHHNEGEITMSAEHQQTINRMFTPEDNADAVTPDVYHQPSVEIKPTQPVFNKASEYIQDTHELVDENLSIEDKEKELIKKALEKYNGKRKQAATELGISERTLYRKIKEYDING